MVVCKYINIYNIFLLIRFIEKNDQKLKNPQQAPSPQTEQKSDPVKPKLTMGKEATPSLKSLLTATEV